MFQVSGKNKFSKELFPRRQPKGTNFCLRTAALLSSKTRRLSLYFFLYVQQSSFSKQENISRMPIEGIEQEIEFSQPQLSRPEIKEIPLSQTPVLSYSTVTKKFEYEACELSIQGYLKTIGAHLFQRQSSYIPKKMVYSSAISSSERVRTVDSIVRMAQKLNFKLETIFTAVNIFNRIITSPGFLKIGSCLKAIASLFVASKYEQVAIPKIDTFILFDFHQKLTKQSVLRVQETILLELNFELGTISPLMFIDMFTINIALPTQVKEKIYNLAKQTLSIESLLYFRASIIAMVCISFILPSVNFRERLN